MAESDRPLCRVFYGPKGMVLPVCLPKGVVLEALDDSDASFAFLPCRFTDASPVRYMHVRKSTVFAVEEFAWPEPEGLS